MKKLLSLVVVMAVSLFFKFPALAENNCNNAVLTTSTVVTIPSDVKYVSRVTKKGNSGGECFSHAVSLTCYKGVGTPLLTRYLKNGNPKKLPQRVLNVLVQANEHPLAWKSCTDEWSVFSDTNGDDIFLGFAVKGFKTSK